MRTKQTYIVLAAVVIIAIMIYSALSTPGIKNLKGNFKELAYIRNEQNSGPVIRLYAVGVDTEEWNEMRQYGEYMPHTKYGTTRVYFFLNSGEIPKKLDIVTGLEARYQEHCIAVYEKNGMGQAALQKYPFRQK